MARKEGVLQFLTHWGDGDVFATLLYKEGQRCMPPPVAVRAYDEEGDEDDGSNLAACVERIDEEFIFADFRYPILRDVDHRPCCEILCKHGSFHLKDLKSDRGTFLNGEKLNNARSRRLATTGDIISMGMGIEHHMHIEKRGGREGVVKTIPVVNKGGIVLDLPIFRFMVQGTENGTTIKWDLRKTRTTETPSTFGDSQYSTVASVLNNPSILENIFKFISVEDLKLARLVSKDWNAEIVKPLARKSCVKFLYPTGIGYKYPVYSMRMFNYISRMNYFHNGTLQIALDYGAYFEGFDKFVWDLTRCLNAVKNSLLFLKMRFQDIPFHGVIPFRKLRAVSFHKNFTSSDPDQAHFNNHNAEDQRMHVRSFVTSVTNATGVSLKVESDFVVNFLSYLSASARPKVHLSNLTELELCSKMPNSSEVLKALAQVSCKLRVVCLGGEVEVYKEENVVAFEEFLKNQGPTLEEIRVGLRYCSYPREPPAAKPTLILNFPSFPRLKFLYAKFYQFLPIMVFPGCLLSNKKLYQMHFPVIGSISISTDTDDITANIYSVFCAPEIDSCSTMKNFSVGGWCREVDPKVVTDRKTRVSELFPNLHTGTGPLLLIKSRHLKCHCYSWYGC